MTTPAEQPHSTKTAWVLALITSLVGAGILFSASPGINWPIWVAAACGSLILSRFVALGRVEKPLIILSAWAIVLGIGFALTANERLQVLSVLSVAMLLGLATITLGAERWSELSAALLAAVPLLAPFRVVSSTAREALDAPAAVSSPRSRALITGTILSVPLVIVLILLLGSADAVINAGIHQVTAWLPDWWFPGRVVFFLFLLILTLGANALSMRQLAAKFPQFPTPTSRVTVGLTEQRMVLWSAAVVLWAFVLLQLSYFIHPPPAVIGNGVSFAEFARKGFAQLSFAVTIVAAIILFLEYARPQPTDARARSSLLRLEIALVIALELVLISAFRRVMLYEQSYGFTEARVFAQAYMVAIGLALLALAWEIRSGAISIALGRRIAEIALGVFTVLLFWNYEAWIVNKNVDRAVTSGHFDPAYFKQLSHDATPSIIKRLQKIPQPDRDTVVAILACKQAPSSLRWYEWNQGASAARAALASWPHDSCEVAWSRVQSSPPGAD